MILKTIIENMGIDPERVWLRWISASEGKQFASIVTEMVEKLKKMGPSPMRAMWDV